MTDAELDELLNTPVHAFDFQVMLGDIQDPLKSRGIAVHTSR